MLKRGSICLNKKGSRHSLPSSSYYHEEEAHPAVHLCHFWLRVLHGQHLPILLRCRGGWRRKPVRELRGRRWGLLCRHKAVDLRLQATGGTRQADFW